MNSTHTTKVWEKAAFDPDEMRLIIGTWDSLYQKGMVKVGEKEHI